MPQNCSSRKYLGEENGFFSLYNNFAVNYLFVQGALDEAFKMVKLYNKAVEKTADLLSQCEAFLSIPLLDLHKIEESHLDFAKKQEESETAKAEVEALTCILKKSITSKAKLQVEKILDDLTTKNMAIREQSQKRNSYIQR